jgi:hypothetical protein
MTKQPTHDGSPSQANALAKMALLTGLFEKLVADAGARRKQVEQLLAEISEERDTLDSADSSLKRAA